MNQPDARRTHDGTGASPYRRLLVGQAIGAFNDNAFKLVAALLAIASVEAALGGGAASEAAAQSVTTRAFVVFTLPLMLVSFPAALWVDRYSKRSVLVLTKLAEIALMALGALALWLEPAGGIGTLVVLGAMGAQSAIFSPAKYGILPQLLPPDRLVAANGLLETWSMIAIIAGTAAAGGLLDLAGDLPWMVGVALTVLSCVGFVSIYGMPAVPPAAPEGATLSGVLRDAFRALRRRRQLRLAAWGTVIFWGVASLVTQNALIYAKTTLGLDATRATLPLAASGLGIAVGAWLVARLTRVREELGWIPLGGFGVAIASAAIGVFTPGFHGTVLWMFAVGAASAQVVVPLNTLVQLRAPATSRGAVIALVNAGAFGGILLGSLGCDLLAGSGVSAASLFVAAGIVALLAVLWAVWLMPQAGVRLLALLLTHTLYRVRVHGAHHVPRKGPALLVSNHVSFVDGLLLSASTDRPIRFLVEESYYNKTWARPLMKLFGFVPIAQSAPPRELLQSIRKAGELLDQGEVVCIFAEGEITRTGQLLPFRRGFQRITKGRDHVPVIPVNLDQVWGSLTSFARRSLLGVLANVPRRVAVSFGEPQPADVSAVELNARVRDLESASWSRRVDTAWPLHAYIVRSARLAPWRFACADAKRPRMSRFGLVAAAVAFARAMRDVPTWRDRAHVGVMLPPSVGGAVVNLAASLAGKTVVNLNFTTGPDAMTASARRAELGCVVTSREFLEKADVSLPDGVEPVWAEDVREGIGGAARLAAAALTLFAPRPRLERACGAARTVLPTDPATVIFSSGSTGEPKGVVLSHFNLLANADGVAQALRLSRDDRLLGSLPLFHSFGTMGLWFALRHKIGIVFSPNPLDAPAVGGLVERYRLTILIATPTFLQLYVRRCEPGQFGSLRHVVSGAEKLPDRIAAAFEDRFGLAPLEGYGATECSPAIAINVPSFRATGYFQSGSRRGTVGRPLPGMTVRVVDPDTGEPRPQGEAGMLEVRGPGVMQGYLGRDELTAEVLRDGWYRTGDIVRFDEDGFIKITDRLARFSKIGGEMVPHGKIEGELHEAAGLVDPSFAVTGIADEKKGERLAVLHTIAESAIAGLVEALGKRGLPNLFIPKADAFVRVDALPVLGTGKLDLQGVRRIAEERLK